MEIYIEIIGFIATFLLGIAYLPPIFKMIKTRNVQGVNKNMFRILLAASILWIVVSIYKESASLIVCNSVTFIECITVLLYIRINK